MVETAVTEQLLVSTVCRERIIVKLLPVDEFRLVDKTWSSERELEVPLRS